MKFVDQLQEYKKQRMDAIQGKKDLLLKLQEDYQNKLDQVKASEEAYKVNFSDLIFENMADFKAEADQLKSKMERAKTQVGLMNIGQFPLDDTEVKAQITEYVDSLKLDELRANVQKKKEEYIITIKAFSEAIEAIGTTRSEIDSLADILEEKAKVPLARAYRLYPGGYDIAQEYLINASDYFPLQRSIQSQIETLGKLFPGTNSY